MHIVSNVQGKCNDDVDALDVLGNFSAKAHFQAKKSIAMEIIDEVRPKTWRIWWGSRLSGLAWEMDVDCNPYLCHPVIKKVGICAGRGQDWWRTQNPGWIGMKPR